MVLGFDDDAVLGRVMDILFRVRVDCFTTTLRLADGVVFFSITVSETTLKDFLGLLLLQEDENLLDD